MGIEINTEYILCSPSSLPYTRIECLLYYTCSNYKQYTSPCFTLSRPALSKISKLSSTRCSMMPMRSASRRRTGRSANRAPLYTYILHM